MAGVDERFAEIKAEFIRDNCRTTDGNKNTLVWVWTSQGLVPADLDDYSEVYKNVYIGIGRVALDMVVLQRLKVTLVVNAAQGANPCSQIDTHADTYAPHGIAFVGVPAHDVAAYNMAHFFTFVSETIEKHIANGGVVYVHCHQGRSRSATLVLAYLMISCGLSLQEALRTVRRRRLITPNDGFLRQLCELDVRLQLDKNKK